MTKPKQRIESYRHVSETKPQQVMMPLKHPDSDSNPDKWRESDCFYVSCRDRIANDGSRDRYALVLGPFRTHQEALELVSKTRTLAEDVDPRACFYAFGTCRAPDGKKDGVLNDLFSKREEDIDGNPE